MKKLFQRLPGIAFLFALGIIARMISDVIGQIDHLILAVIIGILIANTIGLPKLMVPGVKMHKFLLEIGIILMGATLVLDILMDVGIPLIMFVVGFIAFSIPIIEIISRNIFNIPNKLSSLLATGASICGVSAVVAVASGIKSKEEFVAYAVGTILVFDSITLFIYPLIANLLSLPEMVYGIWAGLSMFSTGPAVAAGFAYSEVSGQWSTITKLTRNIFLGVVVILYSAYYTSDNSEKSTSYSKVKVLWDSFPKFVIGFVLVMLIANSSIMTPDQVQSAENAYQWFFLLAFVGLGFQIRIKKMADAGIQPLLAVFIGLLIMSFVSLIVLYNIYIFI